MGCEYEKERVYGEKRKQKQNEAEKNDQLGYEDRTEHGNRMKRESR